MAARNSNISSLSTEQRVALESRLLQKIQNTTKLPTPARAAESKLKPLSFAQQSLWFVQALQPDSAAYNIPQAMRLRGPLDIVSLQKTFAAILQRHEILRTRFVLTDDEPMQEAMELKSFMLPLVDLQSMASRERDVEIQKAIQTEARRPFNLASDLMLRVKLLRIAPDEHILLLTMHHIAADLWSFALLYREMESLYADFSENKNSSLPPLKIQYADFAVRQREQLRGKILVEQLDYWKQQLTGDLPILELPATRAHSTGPATRGAHLSIELPEKLLPALKQLCQREGVTVFMALVAAFQTLLHRYSGQNDVVIGAPIGGRNRLETEELIGYFVNTLVLRSDLSGDPSFVELLRRVRDVVLGAFAHQEMPLDKLVEELRVPRHGCRNPIFNVMLQFQAASLQSLKLAGIETELLPMETGTAKFDLILTLVEGKHGLTGDLEFDRDIFDAAAAQGILEHFRVLLEGIVSNPNEAISRFPILTEGERKQILIEWNATETNYPQARCIDELFEEQVEKTPDAVALIFGGQHMTYAELNRRADELAAHLRKFGVGPDVLVGICAERSMEMIVGLIAILKAGGAYVPLDANYPKERLAMMLADAKPPVLLTQKKFRDVLPAHEGKTICLDEPLGKSAAPNPQSAIRNPQSLAYVIYTSGSTGQPKGVSIPHRGVVRLVKETNYAKFSPDDVFLQFAPISFDASTFEIWGALLNGAKLVIFPAQLPSLEELGQTIREKKITTLWLTAGLFHQMVEHQLENLRGVKQLLAGGDVLSAPHVLSALKNLPETQLINGYGPTESTTFTTCCAIPKNWNGASVPIGKPISNTQVFILDGQLQPVPVGVPGELFIGGDGLAREYLNAPELTAKKFVSVAVENPFSPNRSSQFRLYRTGDRVRWLADGTVEFLGRIDNQVKIRGFRIELGEIESALAQHSDVREAIVVTRDAVTGGKQLVACIVPRAASPLTVGELQQFLAEKIPTFMVPTHFTLLEKFPLTANGKIDRARLPDPESVQPISSAAFVAPRNPVEETVAKIWNEVLVREPIGIHENFFEMGGHSLLATQVMSRVARTFRVELPLRVLFESPTIAALSLQIAQSQNLTVSDQIEIKREIAPEAAEELLGRIDQMSEDEVDSLLAAQR